MNDDDNDVSVPSDIFFGHSIVEPCGFTEKERQILNDILTSLGTEDDDSSYASDYNPYLDRDEHNDGLQSAKTASPSNDNSDGTNNLQPIENLRFSIGDYTDYLLHCFKVEEWWRQHPYKPHRLSDFHQYSERKRRKSLPPFFKIKPTLQNNKK